MSGPPDAGDQSTGDQDADPRVAGDREWGRGAARPPHQADDHRFGDDPGGWWIQIFLPAFALAVPVAGSLTRVVRTAMVEELDRDYVRTAIGAMAIAFYIVLTFACMNDIIALKFKCCPKRASSPCAAKPNNCAVFTSR